MSTNPDIAKRAYQLWEQSGRPAGSDVQHWLQAEAELSPAATTSANAAPAKAGRAQPMLKQPKPRRAVAGAS